MIRSKWFILLVVAVVSVSMVFAQRGGNRGGRAGGSNFGRGNTGRQGNTGRFGGGGYGGGRGRSQEGISRSYQNSDLEWEIDQEFSSDIFTLVRVVYDSTGGSSPDRSATQSKWFDDTPITNPKSLYRWGSGTSWSIDYPESDLNFSFRLQQLTSMQVEPNPLAMRLTNPELCNYPFLYLCAPGFLHFSEQEVEALREYLLNGGFLMMDDFWGDNEWENVYNEMQRVFPGQEPNELELDHPIFNCVFDLKKKPQVLNWQWAERGREDGITWERPDARNPHYMALYDPKGRMVVLMCLNTDTGDGWEREGENEWFFHEFSESQAYPIGINIVFYAMTH